ncbi:MAG: glycerol uptake facilitator-like aquaporin, partial [Sphingobacteriales bacterium]
GAHINPAVSFLFLLKKEMTFRLFGIYLVAQLLGAAVASLLLDLLFPNTGLGVTLPAGSWEVSFGVEFIFTAFLGLGILILRHRVHLWQLAIAIGTLIGLEAYFGGPISGASMNPARSFGPSLISGNWQVHWMYWLAPIFGIAVSHFIIQISSKKNA